MQAVTNPLGMGSGYLTTYLCAPWQSWEVRRHASQPCRGAVAMASLVTTLNRSKLITGDQESESKEGSALQTPKC